MFFIVPCIDSYTKVDLRTVTFDVPPQEILTRDSVTVAVDAVVYFRIFDPVRILFYSLFQLYCKQHFFYLLVVQRLQA
jgi:regulator of protease activity HflC (stomatin/prohibitin superfamily)